MPRETRDTVSPTVPDIPEVLADFIDYGHDADTFQHDVITGLGAARKAIPPKYFYDERGSRLFDAICALPEYYPTRTEVALLRAHAAEIAALLGSDACLVEFGCGSLTKVRVLLDAAPDLGGFIPIDISREHLLASAVSLAADHPGVEVAAVCADFTQPITLPPAAARRRRVGFFPGSTIGNFEPRDALAFLRTAARQLGTGGGMVIGVDLVKDAEVLRAAYNDSRGVTAAFNLNLLSRINRELSGSFEPRHFRHEAVWNADDSRIEMHLISRRAQRVHACGRSFAFAEAETIHTENSYKYTVEGFKALAEQAGFAHRRVWMDGDGLFSLHYLDVA
ncbi:hypothetical protein C882_0157 [Caenispirillum salinarum AK4]|uniref:Histidine-specific methyltransferase SAM-dependent domain-containing protein n=1 Tax=Caenispirillum salinarum AK4 TaxID=1238182 RepID=K9HNL0_9PROT|nr:L-histidine N(alpha)-methyltransferase [Caenispirillum salinarum]EKV30076.1 hypothetical protein C882_0157 [Caenispirillum salinarum AK4]